MPGLLWDCGHFLIAEINYAYAYYKIGEYYLQSEVYGVIKLSRLPNYTASNHLTNYGKIIKIIFVWIL